jgi:prepilin-type N-terminal cleavage/methylation domain-containing protein
VIVTRASGYRSRAVQGFTLLEILVAVAILGVALVSLLGLHARNVRLFAEAQDVTVAGLLAARLASETQAAGFPAVGTDGGTFVGFSAEPSTTFGERIGGNLATGLTWQRQVESTGILNLRRVVISVFPPAASEATQPIVRFELVVRKGGPP